MHFHAFDCLSLPLLYRTRLLPFTTSYFISTPFLVFSELRSTGLLPCISTLYPTMPSLRSAYLALLHSAISLQYNQLCSFPHNSATVRHCASHFQSFTFLYINVLNCVNPLRINTLLLFAVPTPYNSIRYLSRCFSVLDLEFNYR